MDQGLNMVIGCGFRGNAVWHSFASCWAQSCAACPVLAHEQTSVHMVVLTEKVASNGFIQFRHWISSVLPKAGWQALATRNIAAMPTFTHSTRIAQRFDTGSVAEALALAGAQLQCAESNLAHVPSLQVTRVVSIDRHATMAVAVCGHSIGANS